MQVAVIGPNLFDQSKGTFHVHTADCRDGRNGRKYPLDARWETEAATVSDVVLEVYADVIHSDYGAAGGSPEEAAMVAEYESDFHFHNCTKDLA